MSNVEMLLRLVTAAALGSLIGFERERLLWAAGIRTHMLVCVGIWTVAAVGLAVGGGLYLAASTSTVIILIILAPRTSRQNRSSARRQPRR